MRVCEAKASAGARNVTLSSTRLPWRAFPNHPNPAPKPTPSIATALAEAMDTVLAEAEAFVKEVPREEIVIEETAEAGEAHEATAAEALPGGQGSLHPLAHARGSVSSMNPHDDIAALSTPPGRGGLGIVRLSGPNSRSIANRILRAKSPSLPRQAALAELLDDQGHTLDQVLVTCFQKPRSYTGE